ncbi:MFS transporter [Stenotrophomonas sp. NPDC087984]|uniref:MFS transporter n=1 Tax=Streptomyces violaceusniger TaxID=68280 RepID=UPI0009961501|nr:MFS transporter [Streptomyces hygroscopicus]AQW56359.1 transporter [Streptomyces hygroscopicus]
MTSAADGRGHPHTRPTPLTPRRPEDPGTGSTRPAVCDKATEHTPPRKRGAVAVALMLAMALAALDSTVVSTAVPQIVGDLSGFSAFSWLFSGYLLAVTVSLPVYGKLSDTFGRKPVLIVGAAIFLLGSLLCATAWSMVALIAFRVVQGLGGGALQATVQTLAADLYPLAERPKIQARLSSVWAVSAIAGPALGGLLAAYADWRWIFLVNLPVGVVVLWLVVRHLHETDHRPADRPPIDWAGACAVFACGGVLLGALVQGGVAWPWLSVPSLALFTTGLGLAALVVVVERRAHEPIMPGWVWRRRPIAAVNLALGALGLLTVAPSLFLPTYAQSVLGLGPVAAGFVLSVWTLSWPVSASFSQHVYRRIGIRNTAMLGIGAATLLLFAFPLLPYPGQAWQPTALMLLLGAALGLFQLPLMVGVQSTVGWTERGTATASVLFCRQTGQTIGASVFGAIVNGVLSARLVGMGDLDSVTRALHAGTAPEAARRAVSDAVRTVYLGAGCAAALAFLVLLFLAPRRFPATD